MQSSPTFSSAQFAVVTTILWGVAAIFLFCDSRPDAVRKILVIYLFQDGLVIQSIGFFCRNYLWSTENSVVGELPLKENMALICVLKPAI